MDQINLLIVDDNDSDMLLFTESLDIAKEYLQSKDISIEFNLYKGTNGEEALKILNTDIIFDLIFMDIKMPKINGLDVLKVIRDKKISGKVIMFTTSDYERDIIDSYNLKADGYLLKSLDLTEFEENLKSVLFMFIQDNFVYIKNINKKYINIIC